MEEIEMHSPKNLAWETQYNNLVSYRKENGNCLVARRDKNHKQLGAWVAKQRGEKKQGKLSRERIEKLNEIDFVWVARKMPVEGISEIS